MLSSALRHLSKDVRSQSMTLSKTLTGLTVVVPKRSLHATRAPLSGAGFNYDVSFGLTEDQKQYQETAFAFAKAEMEPYAAKWDEDKHFPIPTLKKAAELGFAGIYVDPDYGGTGLGRKDATVIVEALATACPSTAAFVTIHNMCSWMIDTYGNEKQKKELLPELCKMDILASYCLTEPNSGSDAASLQTKAVKKGDKYILNGSKAFISGGGVSDVYLIMCRTGDQSAKGISCFYVRKGTPGLSFGANERKLGWNSQPTAMVIMEDCEVPAENMIGGEGQGFNIAMSGLNGGRINIATCSLGGAYAALKQSVEYTQGRKQFKKPISSFQNTEFKLADMATSLHACRLMVHSAADAMDRKDPSAIMQAAMAKRFATDTCFDIVNQGLQMHGGYGYLKDYPMERFLRDLRVHSILEGTNEIMRLIIGKQLMKDA